MRAGIAAAAVAFALAVTVAAPGTARAGNGAELVRYLPPHAGQLIAADVAHARKAGSAGRIADALRERSPRWARLAASGIDLATAIDTLVAGATGSDVPHRKTLIIDGKTGELLAHLRGDHPPSRVHAGVTIYAVDGGEAAIVDHHLVIAGDGELTDLIDRARGRADALSDAMTDAIDASSASGADVWGAFEPSPSERAGAESVMGEGPRWASFAIAVAERAHIVVTVGLADLHAATLIEAWLQQKLVGPDADVRTYIQTAIGSDLADSIAIARDRREVRISGSLGGDEIDRFASLLGSLL